ncbi:MAG: hypothetical protein RLZZ537_463 [Pseudomonadota bacterium]|jgi:hypothetical protein
MSPAESRYTRRLVMAMVLYIALLFGSILGLKSFAAEWPVAVRALMAVLPVLPIAFVGKIFIDYLGECDEMIRRIELEAVSLSSLIVGLLFLAAGFLMQAGVFTLGGGTVAIWVFPLLCGIYGLTKWLAIRRYR